MNNIYYFTGTGNSLQIAENLSNELGDCTTHKIAEYSGENINSDTLGIVFPVYNLGLPLIICDFLNKLNVSNDTFIYAIANYGGAPGRALDQCEDILKDKNRILSGGFLINMPGNYLIGYGAQSKQTQKKCLKKKRKRLRIYQAL